MEWINDLIWSFVDEKLGIDVTDSSVYAAVAFIVYPDIWKKTKPNLRQLCTFSLFHKVIYKYTHKNLKKLTKNFALWTVLAYFTDEHTFTEFAKTDETLKEHFDIYFEAAQNMRDGLESAIDS